MTEEKEARRQTDTKTSTPANGVLNTEQGGGWLAALKTPTRNGYNAQGVNLKSHHI